MQVLIVDDDRVDRELVRRTLHRSDLNVVITEAPSVDDGLRLVRKSYFDIVLLDYNMPKRNGIDMIVELKDMAASTDTAIVMMSTSEDEQLALKCFEVGAQDFLVKSDISAKRLRRALLNARTRFQLEHRLVKSYQTAKHLSETDPLTGLANRHVFDRTLEVSLANTSDSHFKMALLLVDLDNFKYVNDSLGHDVGDLLLKSVVNRIKGCLRENELFARIGGDEFAITLTGLDSAEHANLVATRVVNVLKEPFSIANIEIKSTASIGVSIYPNNAKTVEDFFKCADIAMYRAKKMGRGRACFFEGNLQKQFMPPVPMEFLSDASFSIKQGY